MSHHGAVSGLQASKELISRLEARLTDMAEEEKAIERETEYLEKDVNDLRKQLKGG